MKSLTGRWRSICWTARGIVDQMSNRARYNVGYPLFVLVPGFFVSPHSLLVARAFNVLLGAAAIVLCHRVARELGAGVLGGLTATTFWSAYLPVSVFAGLAVRKLGYFWLPPLHHGSGAPSRLRGCRSAATPT